MIWMLSAKVFKKRCKIVKKYDMYTFCQQTHLQMKDKYEFIFNSALLSFYKDSNFAL